MTELERVAYRASASFTTAVREHLDRLNTARRAVAQYNEAHSEHPMKVVRDQIDHTIRVIGFVDVRLPDQPPPEGLSRARGRDHLQPARGAAGQPWRELRDQHTFPNLADDVFKPHGLLPYRLAECRYNVAGLYDFDEHGLFVTIPGGYSEPGEHLTQVPLSEFYAAKEKHEAKAVPGV